MPNQYQIHNHIHCICNNHFPDLQKFYGLGRRILGKGQSLRLFHLP